MMRNEKEIRKTNSIRSRRIGRTTGAGWLVKTEVCKCETQKLIYEHIYYKFTIIKHKYIKKIKEKLFLNVINVEIFIKQKIK